MSAPRPPVPRRDQSKWQSHICLRASRAAPRVGRDVLVAHERKAMARAASVRSQCVRPVFVNGEQVVIRSIFEFEWKDGSAGRIEELAVQRREAERIAQEQFVHDPGQYAPAIRP